MSFMSVNLSFWDRLFGKNIYVKNLTDDFYQFAHGFRASLKSSIIISLNKGDKYSNYQAKLIIYGLNKSYREISFYPHPIADGLFMTPSVTLLPSDTYFIELKYKARNSTIKSRIEHKHSVVKLT